MGLAQAALGRRDQAAALLAQAAAGPSAAASARALYEQGNLLAGLGRDREAAATLAAYAARFPAGEEREPVLRLLASVLERQDDPAGAWARWDELVKGFPRSGQADEHLFRRAGAALRSARLADALEDYTRLTRDYPQSTYRAEAFYGIGFVYTRRGEYSRALPFFESALSGVPGTDLAVRAQLGIGISRFNLGSYERALADFEALRRKVKGTEREAEVTMHAARALYRLERLDEAAERFRETAALGQGEAAEALYWQGWSLFRLNRVAEARDTFLDAAKRFPSDPRRPEMVLRAGVCETLLGRDREAINNFDEVLGFASTGRDVREQALYEKGWALSRLGASAEAAAVFDRLAREHPGGDLAPDAFSKLASRALEQGRAAEARDLFLRVARDFAASPLADSALARAAEAALAAGDAGGALDLCWSWLAGRPQGAMLDTVLDTFARALPAAGGAGTARTWDAKVKAAKGIAAGTVARLRIACAGVILGESPAEATAILAAVRAKPLGDRAAAEAGLLAGRCYAAAGDTARALETLESLASSRADRIGAEARMEKARVLEAAGRTGEAVEEFLTIAYLFPDIEDLAAEGLAQAARVARARGERDRARSFEDRLRKEYPESRWARQIEGSR
jgi:TolA-binding protein